MPLATKNGLLIVKDGKVAENCNCCGLTCYCDDGVTKLPQTISASLYVSYIAGFYGAAEATPWRGTYSMNLVSCFRYLATIATPEPRNQFTGILAASTTTLRLDLTGDRVGLFYILPDWLPEGPPDVADYLNGRWVVSGSIKSIICSGGTVKRYWAEDAGYRGTYVEISANPLP